MTDLSSEPEQRGALAPGSRVGKEWPVFTSQGVQDGVATLEVSGEVDIAVAADFVAAALACMAEPGATTLRVDLAAVTFLDSSGLGGLVQVRNAAQEQGKSLVIANVVPSVMKVFTITGLADVLTFDG